MKETILLAQEDVGIFLRGHQTCWNRLILSKSVIDVFVPGKKIFWSFTGQHWGECYPLPPQENNRVNCINYLVLYCQNPTQLNSTQHNSKASSVGVRHSSHVFHPTPPTPRTNFPTTSRPARELKFGTDTH